MLGGNTLGDVNVNISGIPAAFGNKVNVDVEYVVWENKDKAVPSTTLESSKEYDVSDGKITVPVNIKNTKYGYRVYVTAIVPQAPYKDVAATIPGKIEVENYDVGGSGKAFLDKDDDNKGGEYRDDAVDIVKAGSGYAIGYTQEGEWLEYTVKVAQTQDYSLNIRYATSSENAGVKLYIDDKAITDEVVFPKGEDWENYTDFDAGKVSLTAGEHVLKVEIVGNYVNLDFLNFTDPVSTTAIGRPSESCQLSRREFAVTACSTCRAALWRSSRLAVSKTCMRSPGMPSGMRVPT